MPYVFKPDQGPSPLLDAPNIQGNFATYASTFASTSLGVKYNHTPLNDPNQGDHEVVLMELLANDPGVDTDLVSVYSKNATSAVSTEPQVFVQIPKFLPTINDTTNAANIGMQLTYNKVNVVGPQYQSFIAGGYLVYIGSTTDITLTITLSPIPTKILVAIATPNTMTTAGTPQPFNVSTTILSSSTFKINSGLGAATYKFTWMAIALA